MLSHGLTVTSTRKVWCSISLSSSQGWVFKCPASHWVLQHLCPAVRSFAMPSPPHLPRLFLGWQSGVGFKYAFLDPLWARSDLCLHCVPPLWIIRVCSLFFVSRPICPVKLRVDGLGSWWHANVGASDAGSAETHVPAVCSLWCLPHPSFPLHSPFTLS